MKSPETIATRVRVQGKVQGVWFRAFTREQALENGVHGTVQNLPDGSVEAVLEGEPAAVEAVLAGMRRGPPGSSVTALNQEETVPSRRFTSFRILR